MGKPSPPAAPNPQVTAQAQTQSNVQTAIADAMLGRINQTTPYGSSTYTITGYQPGPGGTQIPIYAQTTSLSPQEQQLYNINTQGQIGQGNIALGMQNQVANTFGHPIDTSGLPGLTSTINPQDVNTQVQNAQNAAYNAQTQYLDPRFAQQRAQLANQDANMGITRGSNAWNTDQLNQNLAQNQAYQSAQNAAVAAGQQEQNTLFGQAGQQAELQNQANQQGLQNIFALTNQPLNAYSALMGGAQVQQPNFIGTGQYNINPTDVAGITNNAFNNQMAAYNAQMAANPLNALFSLGGSLGSAAILACDRRLKTDVEILGIYHGIPQYSFTYKDDPSGTKYIGPMADDVEKINPKAVFVGNDGMKRIIVSEYIKTLNDPRYL